MYCVYYYTKGSGPYIISVQLIHVRFSIYDCGFNMKWIEIGKGIIQVRAECGISMPEFCKWFSVWGYTNLKACK